VTVFFQKRQPTVIKLLTVHITEMVYVLKIQKKIINDWRLVLKIYLTAINYINYYFSSPEQPRPSGVFSLRKKRLPSNSDPLP